MSERSFLQLISGTTPGAAATMARAVLWCASLPYSAAMRLRNLAFDTGIQSSQRVDVPVIAIGNLTTGGTGKTPIVAAVVRLLQELGHTPGIVSRGYRADPSGENDEKRVLAQLCPNVPHEQNPDRIAAAERLLSDTKITAIVLDDAFQHRRIARDLNVVLIDATNPFGYDYVLPRGLLREPMSGLRRADMILITRADQVPIPKLRDIEETVLKYNPQLADRIHHVTFQPSEFLTKSGDSLPLTTVKDEPLGILTAIGNPAAFVATCEQLGANVVWARFFTDHHHYTVDEIELALTDSKAVGARRLLVTLKDFVKIPDSCSDCLAVQIDSVFTTNDGESFLRERLESVTR